SAPPPYLHSFPTRRSSDLPAKARRRRLAAEPMAEAPRIAGQPAAAIDAERLLHAPAQEPITVRPVGEPRDGGAQPPEQLGVAERSEEHTSELQSRGHLVCR